MRTIRSYFAHLLAIPDPGANVRRARAQRGLTQEALAELSGQDLSYLQRIERGATNLSVAVLWALAVALNVSPSLLVRRAKLPPGKRGRPTKARRPTT
jgi:transcriptional regulator with XRE-family HTH domain